MKSAMKAKDKDALKAIRMILGAIKQIASSKHGALRRKSKDWLARNQDNVTADCCFNELAL